MELKTKIPEVQYSQCDFKVRLDTVESISELEDRQTGTREPKHRENTDQGKRTVSAVHGTLPSMCHWTVREP